MNSQQRTGHACAQAGCDEDATYVVMESHALAMLFRPGAGLVCDRHAKAFSHVGGVPCPIDTFICAAAEWHEMNALGRERRSDA